MDRWIKISVMLSSHWLWEDAELLKWWLDLLFMASWEDKKRLIGRNLVTVKRGQLVASVSFLCNRWGRSRKKITPFLQMLEDEGMIKKNEEHNISIITICNYDKYQSTVEGAYLDTHRNTDKQSVLGGDSANIGTHLDTHLDTHVGTHQGTPNVDNIEVVEEVKNKKTSTNVDAKKTKSKKKSGYADTIKTPEELEFENGMKEHYPRISKMDEPLTLEQYKNLTSKYSVEKIMATLQKMENWKDLLRKNVSAYLTANNWLR